MKSCDILLQTVNVKKCIFVSVITFFIRYVYVNFCMGFSLKDVIILNGFYSQLFFGGLFVDYSFDIISLSFQTLIYIYEICYLTVDITCSVNANLTLLLPRYGKLSRIYIKTLIYILCRNTILIAVNYILYLITCHQSVLPQDLKIMVLLWIELFTFQLLSYLLCLWKSSISGYIISYIILFLPIMICGFNYSMGNDNWTIGGYSVFHCCIFNWHNSITVNYLDYAYEYSVSCAPNLSSRTSCYISIILCSFLMLLGNIICKRKEIL